MKHIMILPKQWAISKGIPVTQFEKNITGPPIKRYGMEHKAPKNNPYVPDNKAKATIEDCLCNNFVNKAKIGQQ